MDYPFSDFVRHISLWKDARLLADVLPIPEDRTKVVHIGAAQTWKAVYLRVLHMLLADGCPVEQQTYRGARFFQMMRFLALHQPAFLNAGFPAFDDGEAGTVTNDMLRAVHEEFRGEPGKYAERVPVAPVIQRARTYPSGWIYE